MNDTFSSQNSVAFYQAPATPATPVDPVMPASAPMDQTAMGGQASNQDASSMMPATQQPTVPEPEIVSPVTADEGQTYQVTDIAQSEQMIGGPDVVGETSTTLVSSAPSTSANESQSQQDAAKPTPEEIVKRLADRIKAYEAKSAARMGDDAPVSASPTEPTVTFNQPTVTAVPSQAEPTQVVTDQGSSTQEQAQTESKEETLESQNIFELLGVSDGTDAEKDAFLDQLQQVIWEDFLESDVELLLTKSESEELKTLLSQEGKSDAERQELAVSYLEKLVPDLENIMLEKALELKKEMVFERIAGMRELYSGKPEILTKLTEAELLFKQDKWQSGAVLLNSLK